MNQYSVYLADIHGSDVEIERKVLQDIATLSHGKRTDDDKEDVERVLNNAQNVDALGVRHTRVNRAIIQNLKHCRIIARFGGGYDNIDIAAATENGIIVTFVPDYCTDAVAEHALMFTLMGLRSYPKYLQRLADGYWSAQGLSPEMAKDTTLGIIGLGRIGGALSRKATSVGFNIIAYDPFIPDEKFRNDGAIKKTNLNDILASADIISINAPLTRSAQSEYPTYRLLGANEFNTMKNGAYIVNVSRMEIIDSQALFEALNSGKIGGLATDVIEGEPRQNTYLESGQYPLFDKLWQHPDITITPHSAFASSRSINDVKLKGANEIKRVLNGQFPREIAWINPEVKERYLQRFA